jgi:hypothetical protein
LHKVASEFQHCVQHDIRKMFGRLRRILRTQEEDKPIPIGSMSGIYANIWGVLMVNVTIYSSTMDPSWDMNPAWYFRLWRSQDCMDGAKSILRMIWDLHTYDTCILYIYLYIHIRYIWVCASISNDL